jgi:hypothetical protein
MKGTNCRIQDEYAMRKGTPSPIIIKTIDKFGELGVDTRKVETASSYKRAPWMIDAVASPKEPAENKL